MLELGGKGSTHDVAPSFTSPHSSECVDMRLETLMPWDGMVLSLKDWPLVCCDLLLRLPDPADRIMDVIPWLGASMPVSSDSNTGLRNGMHAVITEKHCSSSVVRMYAQKSKEPGVNFPPQRVT